MARRYGKWPHEVLELAPDELAIALAAMEAGQAHAADRIDRASRRPGAMIFPVVDLGEGG